ncbi:hypothetical protein K458DRAFT_317898 [Lentithecium fluviatile CBS 122367]|uniref:Uncharacterized protein n=1 Tax=Lentithecium fluviatile CBS 122367 TaxID=1168545 RepID=A0A6G1IIL7_9PLEO|nr:hypothetical protein K458DRAFT_317898 [Lentithecium fluviatile CBS 122367]
MAFSETEKVTFNALAWFDENAAYEDEDPEDPNPALGPNIRDLYKQQDERDGAVKSYFRGDGSGPLVFSKEKSNYCLNVERLIWVDGYRMTNGDGPEKKHVDAMTLVVLQLSFDAGSTRFAEAELRFQSDKKGGPDPEVVAWGPFRRPETWNFSKAQRSTKSTADLSIAGGYAGQGLSAKLARENETSWEKIDFDLGTSTRVYSHSKSASKPHGVRWKLQENQLYRKGITSEVRLAVLISREQSQQPYWVTFRLAVHNSTLGTLVNKSQTVLGMPSGKEVRWRATPKPGSKDGCYGDGAYIVESGDVDPYNLGALIRDPSDSTNLKPSWLNASDRFEVPNPGNVLEPKGNTEALGDMVILSAPAKDTAEVVQEGCQKHEDAGNGHRDHLAEPLLPPGSSPPVSGYNRLVLLETRVAQAEARLAAQDVLIFKLQQGLARMEHVVSVGARAT